MRRAWPALTPLLLAAGVAGAVDVLSAAHSPPSPSNRFTLQCGRTGTVRVSAVVDVGKEAPAVLLGGLDVNGAMVAMKRREYPDGPGLAANARKLGGRQDRWILDELFAWKVACRKDCGGIAVDGQPVGGSGDLEFRMAVGGEGRGPDPDMLVFAPRTVAETERLSLRCQEATALGD